MDTAAGRLLETRFGFRSFRPGQAEALERLLAGQHALVVMPTGAGKSLIYQLAALTSPGVTLVVSPLISLMKDQVASLARRGIRAAFINSSLTADEQAQALQGMADGRYTLVYVAPERLRSVAFQKALSAVNVGLLAVDEAHCISEWGHDFRPDYLRISAARQAMRSPVTAALTATATPRVQDEIVRLLGIEDAARIVTGFNRPNLSLEVLSAYDPESKLRALQSLLTSEGGTPAIIYAGTRRDAEEVAAFASEVLKIEALSYHAGLDHETRRCVQESFMAGDAPVVAATSAFGMGIDRQDVRLVVHFNVPGTLEAYYQEAGRAGRDGDPARAVLLYAMQDRALQEFFIENDAVSAADMRAVFDAVKNAQTGETWVSLEDLSVETGLGEIRVRLSLAVLERAGLIGRQGDEGPRMLLSAGEWDARAAREAERAGEARRRFRHSQLDQMIAYAESTSCRRRIILQHFGDPGEPSARECCDNCRHQAEVTAAAAAPREFGSLEANEKTALVILDALRRLKWGVGMHKLAQLLSGSTAEHVQRFGYTESPYYGRLAGFRQSEVVSMIKQLVELRYLKATGDAKLPVLSLTPFAERAIKLREPIPLRLPRQPPPKAAARKMQEREAGGTYELTEAMFRAGKTPQQIAAERALFEDTVYNHLSRLVASGAAALEDVVPRDIAAQIRGALDHVGSAAALGPVKSLLPESIGYGQIRCVAEQWRRDHPDEPRSARIREQVVACVSAMPGALPRSRIADLLSGDHPERLGNHTSSPFHLRLSGIPSYDVLRVVDQLLAEGVLIKDERRKIWPAGRAPQPEGAADADIAAFLSRPHAQKLSGPWECGWSLGFHSSFSGAEWQRTGVGSLAYRLKYQRDRSVLEPLVREALNLLEEHPELSRFDAVVPVPPSVRRDFDHVAAFAEALGKALVIPVLKAVTKERATEPQKEFRTLAQKRRNVAGAFRADRTVAARRVLLIDDLFDSGATLGEIAQTMRRAGARAVLVLTMTRTIHSDG